MSVWEYCTVVTEWRGRTPTIVSSSEMGDALIGNFTTPITDMISRRCKDLRDRLR